MAGPKIAPGEYVAVFRGSASARFLNDEGIAFDVRELDGETIHFEIYTRHVDEGLSYPTPRELVVEARGQAESTDDLLVRAGGVARDIANWLAFIANAAVDDVEAHLVFDNTPGRSERSFVEVYVPDESGMVRQGRKIPLPEGFEAVGRIFSLSPEEGDYVRRAIANYALALQRWHLGGEILALASLYIAAENLDKAAVIVQARRDGVTPEELAARESLKLRALQARTRRDVVFRGDEEAYNLAKDAVDGFEHGSMDLGEVHRRATEACPRVFAYIRTAIVDLLGLEPATRDLLLGAKYGEPLDALSLRTLVRGAFINVRDEVAAADEKYPVLSWRKGLARLELAENRELTASIKETMTVRCADGVSFRTDGMEIHGRLREGEQPGNLQVERLETRSAEAHADAGVAANHPASEER